MFIEELLFQEKIPENYTDWRLPENRLEAFSRVVYTRMVEGDLDHHHSGKVIVSEMGLSNEDKLLYSLIFGQSYRNHWAMLAMQIFPDILNVPDKVLEDWHNKHWSRMMYGNDTKWNVRKFPIFIQSIKQLKKRVGNLYEYFGNLANSSSTKDNYYATNAAIKELMSMGRMTAWLAQQTMFELFNWDIDHWDQQLYDGATWSQYDSLCYLFNRLDLARAQVINGKIEKYKPTKEDIKVVEGFSDTLMAFVNERIPFNVDVYNVESAECEYRKTAYGPKKIKEYTYWTTNELVEQYSKLRGLWDDYSDTGTVDWMPYVKGIMTKGANVRKFGYEKDYFRVLVDFGLNLNTHKLFKDEPNAFEVLNLGSGHFDSIDLLLEDWGTIPEEEQQALQKKYDPVNYLIFKGAEHASWLDQQVDFSYLNRVSNNPTISNDLMQKILKGECNAK